MITELFETRAERGIPRGADAVWFNATTEANHAQPGRQRQQRNRSRPALAVLLVGATIGIGLWLLPLVDNGRGAVTLETGPVSTAQKREPQSNLGSEPKWIAVAGLELDADSYYLEDSTLAVAEDGDDNIQIFANPEEPFSHPILGLDLFEGGGFRPWAANLGDKSLDSLSDQLQRDGGRWRMSPESDLVEAASLRRDWAGGYPASWHYVFRGETGATVTWQAGRHNGEGIWSMLSWAIDRNSGPDWSAALTETTVLGQPAVVVMSPGGNSDEVFWEDGEYVYRLMTQAVVAEPSFQEPPSGYASDAVSRLYLVEREEWESMVAGVMGPSWLEIVASWVTMAGLLGWLVSAGYFVVRQRFVLAAICVGTVGAWFAMSSDALGWAVAVVISLACIWGWVLWSNAQRDRRCDHLTAIG